MINLAMALRTSWRRDEPSRNSCKRGVAVIESREYDRGNQQMVDIRRERTMNTAELSQSGEASRYGLCDVRPCGMKKTPRSWTIPGWSDDVITES